MQSGSSMTMKCVIVGDGAVGKTCMLISYCTDKFPPNYVPTVFDNYVVTIVAGGHPYSLGLFDTAGQEGYDRLRLLAYPGTDIFLLCFSVVKPDSFLNVTEVWLRELREACNHACIILVGTQEDLRNDHNTLQKLEKRRQKPVTTEQGHKLAAKIGAECYVECSALTQKGLKSVFDEAILSVLSPKKVKRDRKGILHKLSCLT